MKNFSVFPKEKQVPQQVIGVTGTTERIELSSKD